MADITTLMENDVSGGSKVYPPHRRKTRTVVAGAMQGIPPHFLLQVAYGQAVTHGHAVVSGVGLIGGKEMLRGACFLAG